MTEEQWEKLRKVVSGELLSPLPVGFIVDSPWLPNWYGIRMLDYFSNDELWLAANLKVVSDFPDVIFLPGFWAEFGMCTEPSAFGVRCSFPANDFPQAHKLPMSLDELNELPLPNVATDGLLPFVLNRLRLAEEKLHRCGHQVYFAVARGPLNIAAHLMGTTELLTAMMLEPDKVERLLHKITTFLKQWLHLQRESFATIDGLFLLDDIVGFVGEEEFRRFALPFLKELYAEEVMVKFFHNDAPCKVSAFYLVEMGVNLFNMGFDLTLSELQHLTQHKVTLLGNIPPRDVLASGTPEQVEAATLSLLDALHDRTRVIVSCGGGMPPGVKTENILAMVRAVERAS